jgi:hypothetical protein
VTDTLRCKNCKVAYGPEMWVRHPGEKISKYGYMDRLTHRRCGRGEWYPSKKVAHMGLEIGSKRKAV